MKVKQNFFVGYNGKPCGYTNEEVYNKIMSGSETLSPEVDNEADIFLQIRRKYSRNVIGYTNGTKFQYTYINWFNKMSIEALAGHLAHEWTHRVCFVHDKRNSYSRQFSVPYACGYFVRDWRE